MAAHDAIWLTFSLLGLSIAAVWVPAIPLSRQSAIPPWIPLFGAAIACALVAGFIKVSALAALALFAALAYATGSAKLGKTWRIVCGIATGVVALALAIHKLPGFNNPKLINNAQFSPDAIAYTQYANFDKAAVGLILIVFLCRRAGKLAEWRELFKRAAPIAAVTIALVLAMSVAAGFVRPDFKLPPYIWIFLGTNLLFTCVAEEAFFRGFLQERLAGALPRGRAWQIGAVVFSGLLFGLAHLGGGATYAALASVAGIGYATAYAVTRRIEAAILTHFALNAIHFIGFTYPALQTGI